MHMPSAAATEPSATDLPVLIWPGTPPRAPQATHAIVKTSTSGDICRQLLTIVTKLSLSWPRFAHHFHCGLIRYFIMLPRYSFALRFCDVTLIATVPTAKPQLPPASALPSPTRQSSPCALKLRTSIESVMLSL